MPFANNAQFEDDFRRVGKDVTAGFEPIGAPSEAVAHASSENVEVAGAAELDEPEDDLEDDDDEIEDEDEDVDLVDDEEDEDLDEEDDDELEDDDDLDEEDDDDLDDDEEEDEDA